MPTCPRTQMPDAATTDCPHCAARPDEDCPLATATPGLLTEPPVTAGTTGVCDVDGEECQSCQ